MTNILHIIQAVKQDGLYKTTPTHFHCKIGGVCDGRYPLKHPNPLPDYDSQLFTSSFSAAIQNHYKNSWYGWKTSFEKYFWVPKSFASATMAEKKH